MNTADAIRALGALAQETRLEAFRLLVQAGPDGKAAGALAERLGVPATTLSFHLAQLANAGLAIQRREGRSIIYSAAYSRMNDLLGFMTENCCGSGQPGCASACAESEAAEGVSAPPSNQKRAR